MCARQCVGQLFHVGCRLIFHKRADFYRTPNVGGADTGIFEPGDDLGKTSDAFTTKSPRHQEVSHGWHGQTCLTVVLLLPCTPQQICRRQPVERIPVPEGTGG